MQLSAHNSTERLVWVVGSSLFLALALPFVMAAPVRADILLLTLGLGVVLTACSVIDWQTFLLPNALTLPHFHPETDSAPE